MTDIAAVMAVLFTKFKDLEVSQNGEEMTNIWKHSPAKCKKLQILLLIFLVFLWSGPKMTNIYF